MSNYSVFAPQGGNGKQQERMASLPIGRVVRMSRSPARYVQGFSTRGVNVHPPSVAPILEHIRKSGVQARGTEVTNSEKPGMPRASRNKSLCRESHGLHPNLSLKNRNHVFSCQLQVGFQSPSSITTTQNALPRVRETNKQKRPLPRSLSGQVTCSSVVFSCLSHSFSLNYDGNRFG